MEARQYVTQRPMDHWRNKEEMKRYLDKWQWKHEEPKPVEHSISSFKSITQYNTSGKTKKSHNLALHLKQLDKEEQIKPKVSRRKEIIKTGGEINEKQMKKTIENTNATKSWFFENINKIDKCLARFIKKKRERAQINEIRYKKGEVAMDTTETQEITRPVSKYIPIK